MRHRTDPFYLGVWYTGEAEMRRATPANTYVAARGMAVRRRDGRVIEDWGGQYFVNNIGAGRAAVAAAMAAQSRRMSWISPTDFVDVRLALTRDLRSVLPAHLTVPQYTVGGSDALETAIRAARKVTGRKQVLTLTQSYHGDTMTMEAVSGGAVMPYGDARPWAVHAPSPYDLWEKAGRDWDTAGDLALDGVEAALRRHGPRRFACMIVEPVMGSPGCIPVPRGLARGLRALCDRYGIKLVADEVITGFGRTGRWFGSQTVGLRPDAVALAKGLTGGYAPLGAAVFERGWGERLRREGMYHGMTFAGHPIGAAAARATIAILRRERLVERAARAGGDLRRRLLDLRAAHPAAIVDVRGAGLFQAIQITGGSGRRGGARTAEARVEAIVDGALRDGLRLLAGTDGRSILFCPPFTVTDRQMTRLCDVLDRRLRDA